ncbi:MAG: FkbM family methyltransferase [Pseudomonadota bacterium]
MKQTAIRLLRSVLPGPVRRMLPRLAAHLDREAFEAAAFRYLKAPSMGLGLAGLRDRGLRPATILDIGAFQGDWSRMAAGIWPDAEITMVEGNREKEPALSAVAKELNAGLEIALLGPEDGQSVEFVVMETGSSVFEENSPLDRRRERREVRSLDALFAGRRVDLIKIDVQGYELEVLAGGQRVLGEAEAVLLEIALIEINRGAPLLDEVVAYLAARDLIAVEVLELHRRPLDGAMNQIDILFVRRSSPLFANTAHF